MKRSPIIVTVCLVGIALALLSLYFGALLPFRKGQAFIAAQRNVASVRTVDDFKSNFDVVFDFYSPVGTEEITKFLAGNIHNIVRAGQNEEVSRELVAYIEQRLFKNEVRHLLLAARLRETLWLQYESGEDYLAALRYYQKAHEIGPNLPPPLYGMLDLYIASEDEENVERTARMILEKWPNDARVRDILENNDQEARP
jgi:tetratricopeptide (TPR) repeat protein